MATKLSSSTAAGREIHMLDSENLLGSDRVDRLGLAALKPRYLDVSGARGDAHFYVGASHSHNCLEAALGWGCCRAIYERGADGAERALLDRVPLDYAAGFARVVIGSGDGYFTSFAARVQTMGVQVTVVCRRESLARSLRMAVRDVRYLDEAPTMLPPNGFGMAA